MKFDLVIYSNGTAVLSNDAGETVWASDADDKLGDEFDDFLDGSDGERLCDYLTDAGYIPEESDVDIIEDNDELLDAGDDGDDDGDEDEDEDEAEGDEL